MWRIYSRALVLVAAGSAGLLTPALGQEDPRRVSGHVETGIASWYGAHHHGRRTANGEVFNEDALTAAHKSLPMGSRVQVTSRHTGRSVIVRINDRGPYKAARIIDLSEAAAQAIGLEGIGEVSVSEVHTD
jgi:rare lipoprotein A